MSASCTVRGEPGISTPFQRFHAQATKIAPRAEQPCLRRRTHTTIVLASVRKRPAQLFIFGASTTLNEQMDGATTAVEALPQRAPRGRRQQDRSRNDGDAPAAADNCILKHSWQEATDEATQRRRCDGDTAAA
jgi:hypothetical protein